jgi:N-acetylglutamate synthase-like GNAT family acetyltransferase
MLDQVPGIDVRRARPSDAGSIVSFINPTLPADQQIEIDDVVERFGAVGFLLAEKDGEMIGVLGWRAENLVAQVTDFLVWPAEEKLSAGRALLAAMEQSAVELLCETVVLFLARDCPADVLAFWAAFDYLPREVSELPKAWQEAILEFRPGEETMVVKQLREDLVRRPL